jgi:uncharacterized protein (TIGR00255 family)
MRSMTGFGVGDVSLPEGRVVAEIRSVNQRFLDVRARLPRELADLALFAEQVARERIRRGRVELYVHTEGTVLAPLTLDRARARAAFRALSELRDELAPGSEVPFSVLAAVPDLFAPPAGAEITALRAAVKTAIERSIEAMETMCRREGEALAADLRTRTALLGEHVGDVARLAPASRDAARRRMRERVERLLADVAGVDALREGGAAPIPPRLEAEIALLADRSDFAEELTRLASHLDQLSSVIADDRGEPVGRRLDFLLQEMLREANTLGAKAQDAALSHRVVAIKVELERLREQVQNIE